MILRQASLAILVLLVLWLPSTAAYDPKVMKERFESWLARYDRQFKSKEEWALRFGIYQMNVQLIDFVNSQKRSYKLTDNIFADLSNAEFRANRLGYRAVWNPALGSRHCHHGDSPGEVDWRKKGAVTPVKNQGQCGIHFGFYNNNISP